jgi:hypothetical protein
MMLYSQETEILVNLGMQIEIASENNLNFFISEMLQEVLFLCEPMVSKFMSTSQSTLHAYK